MTSRTSLKKKQKETNEKKTPNMKIFTQVKSVFFPSEEIEAINYEWQTMGVIYARSITWAYNHFPLL